jgi:hypothetical protein
LAFTNYTRVESLTRAIEDLLECFDVNTDPFSMELADGTVGVVTPITSDAIEHAMHVLYDEADYDEEAA